MKTNKQNLAPELQNRIAPTVGQDKPKPDPLAKRAVFFDGPYANPDPKQEGDEMPFWTVFVGFAETGDAVRTIYEVNDFKRAESLAQSIAKDRQLELVADATTA